MTARPDIEKHKALCADSFSDHDTFVSRRINRALDEALAANVWIDNCIAEDARDSMRDLMRHAKELREAVPALIAYVETLERKASAFDVIARIADAIAHIPGHERTFSRDVCAEIDAARKAGA